MIIFLLVLIKLSDWNLISEDVLGIKSRERMIIVKKYRCSILVGQGRKLTSIDKLFLINIRQK